MQLFFSFLRGILLNTAVLLAVAAVFNIIRGASSQRQAEPAAWKQGMAFGLAATITMAFPVSVMEGVFFDCRVAVIGVASLLGGPMAALTSLPLPMLYRMFVGGPGMVPGVAEIVIPAVLGSLCHASVARRRLPLSQRLLLACGLLVSVGTNLITICVVFVAIPERLPEFPWRLMFLIIGFTTVAFQFLASMILIDRKRFEVATELANSQRRLDITLNSIGDAVIVCDAQARVVRINPVASSVTGWCYDDAVGKPIGEVFHVLDAETRETLQNPVERVLLDQRNISLSGRAILLTRKGQDRHVTDSGAPIYDHDGVLLGAILVFRDVTEEMAMERHMRQAQKMEAIGELASGIAHDFNNTLTGIMGYANLLEQELADDPGKRDYLRGITDSVENASHIIGQLLAFSRQPKGGARPISLHTALQNALELISHTFDRRIKIIAKLEAESDTVIGDASMLQQVFLNLAINARDAMPREAGRLTFQTSINRSCPSGQPVLPDGPYLRLEVSDTGTGIPAAHLEKIFQPFFTTKDIGRGTGMGLATVYGTVQQMGGNIKVDSRLGEGTTFCLLFPLSTESLPLPETNIQEITSGHGCILVADDNAAVREIVRQGLARMHYTAVLCEDGVEALAWFRTHGAEADLVILDINMPQMGGVACFREMQKIRPDVRCMFMTGHMDPNLNETLCREGAMGTLTKPFRLHDLSREIAQALARSPR